MALLYRNGRAISSALPLRFMKKTYHLTLHSRIFLYFRSVDAFSLRRIFQTLRVLCHCGEKAQQPARNGGKHIRTCRDEALEIADEFCITPFGSAVGNDERSARKAFHRSGGDPRSHGYPAHRVNADGYPAHGDDSQSDGPESKNPRGNRACGNSERTPRERIPIDSIPSDIIPQAKLPIAMIPFAL